MTQTEHTLKLDSLPIFGSIAEGTKFIIMPTPETDPTGDALTYGAYLFVKIRDKNPESIDNAICIHDGGSVSVPHDAKVIIVM